MMNDIDLDEYNALVAELYRGPHDPQPWEAFLARLREMTGARLTVLTLSRPQPNNPGVSFASGIELTGEGMRRYADKYAALDPFVNLPDGQAMTILDIIPSDELQQSAFYRRYMAPTDQVHVLGVDIHQGGAVRVLLRAIRGADRDNFSRRDKTLLNLLAPHLRQVLQWLDSDLRSKSERSVYESVTQRLSVGTLLLDRRQRIVHCNPVARHLLDRRDGLSESNGRLLALQAQENAALQRMLKQALEDHHAAVADTISLTRQAAPSALYLTIKAVSQQRNPDGTLPLEASAEADAPRIAVLINVPEMLGAAQQAILQQLFDFTPSESRLAIALANGMSLDEIADELCVSRNTVRSHLRAAFQKTGTNQQSALVSLVLRSVAGMG